MTNSYWRLRTIDLTKQELNCDIKEPSRRVTLSGSQQSPYCCLEGVTTQVPVARVVNSPADVIMWDKPSEKHVKVSVNDCFGFNWGKNSIKSTVSGKFALVKTVDQLIYIQEVLNDKSIKMIENRYEIPAASELFVLEDVVTGLHNSLEFDDAKKEGRVRYGSTTSDVFSASDPRCVEPVCEECECP